MIENICVQNIAGFKHSLNCSNPELCVFKSWQTNCQQYCGEGFLKQKVLTIKTTNRHPVSAFLCGYSCMHHVCQGLVLRGIFLRAHSHCLGAFWNIQVVMLAFFIEMPFVMGNLLYPNMKVGPGFPLESYSQVASESTRWLSKAGS